MSYRIVVDTNILVSAVLKKQSRPAAIIDAVINGGLLLISSHAILKGARRVFSYPKLQILLKKNQVTGKEIDNYIDAISKLAILVPGKLKLDVIKNDPSDNEFLICAVEGQADFIVSGDRHLTDIKLFQDIQIINPAEFLGQVAEWR